MNDPEQSLNSREALHKHVIEVLINAGLSEQQARDEIAKNELFMELVLRPMREKEEPDLGRNIDLEGPKGEELPF